MRDPELVRKELLRLERLVKQGRATQPDRAKLLAIRKEWESARVIDDVEPPKAPTTPAQPAAPTPPVSAARQQAAQTTKEIVEKNSEAAVARPPRPFSAEVAQEAPQPQKPAAPTQSVVEGKPSGRRITDGGKAPGLKGPNENAMAIMEVERSLQPHKQSEAEWIDKQLDVQREVGKTDWDRFESRFDYAARELDLDPDSARQWVRRSSVPGRIPLHIQLGLKHTQGNEGFFGAMMRASGLEARSIAEDSATRFAGAAWNQSPTDFEIIMPDGSRRLIDVQNVYDPTNGRLGARTTMNLGITKQDGGAFGRSWRSAAPTDTMQSILKQSYEGGGDKPFRSKFTMSDKGFLLPVPMDPSDFVKTEPSMFQQDGIIGGLFDKSDNFPSWNLQEERGITQRLSHGSFDPKLPKRIFGLDLEKMRDTILPMTKADIQKLQPRSDFTAVNPTRKGANLTLPLEVMEEIGDSKSTLDALVSPAVKEAVNRASAARGGKDLFAGIPINGRQAVETAKDMARKWRGGVFLGALDGASREVGVDIGKGDYRGAATTAATNMAVGAGAEKMLGAGAKAITRRMPGMAARFGAGSAGSGGLLTPVMATIAAVELADGVVEGVTGKDTIAHVNDGMVKPYYQRSTGDNRTEEQIQANLSGPKRVYDSGIPKHDKPQMSKEAVAKASAHLSKLVPEVKPEPPAPTPTVKPTVTPTVKPQQKPGWQRALDQAGSWVKGTFGL